MLIAFFLGLIAGVAAQLQQAMLWEGWIYAACGITCLAGLVGCAVRGSVQFERQPVDPWASSGQAKLSANGILRLSICFALAAGLTFAATGWRATQFMQTVMNPALEGADIDVVGVIPAMPQRLETGLRYRLDVEAAHLNDKPTALPPRLLLAWYKKDFDRTPDDADLIGQSLEDAPRQPRAGERWQFTVRLKAPHGNANPHGFDYELWAWEQGVQATGYVRENKRQTPPKRLGIVAWNPFYAMERARQSVRDAVFSRLGTADSRSSAGVIAALITGDQNAIERADWDVFRATGVAHLMSISGLHITMFAWMASGLIGWCWRKTARLNPPYRAPGAGAKDWQSTISKDAGLLGGISKCLSRACLWLPAVHAGLIGGLLLATLYAWFSGWGVPAQRTIWMLGTFTLLRLSGLRWPWFVAWLLAAVVVLSFDPWALLQAGFWLSFVAVGVLFASQGKGLLGMRDPIQQGAAQTVWRRMLPVLKEQWVITFALAPLTLLLFQQVSLVGLLANAVAIPLVTLIITPLAMLGVVAPLLWDAAASTVQVLAMALHWLAALPHATVAMAARPLLWSVLAVIGGLLLVLPTIPEGIFSYLSLKRRMGIAGCGFLMLLPAMLWQPLRPSVGQFELLAIDIGQGNSVLVRTAKHSLLFDTGPRFSRESDAGHRTLNPLLRALGERLDVLVLSHRDSDHTGGAKAVIAMQTQAQIITSVIEPTELEELGLPSQVTACTQGQNWDWDGVRFEVLHPTAADLDNKAKAAQTGKPTKPNAISCVLKITSQGSHSALLTADIEEPQERALVTAQAGKLPSTVLLVPHHGSKTSSSAAFLDAVHPKIALVQAGYRNRFAHPRPEVMARYRERGVRAVESSFCGGAMWLSSLPDAVQCQRDVGKRYWMHQRFDADASAP